MLSVSNFSISNRKSNGSTAIISVVMPATAGKKHMSAHA